MVHQVDDPLSIANRLRPVLLRLNRELRREIHSLGVTGSQVSILNAIERQPGIGQGVLAEAERISPAAMSGHLVRLETAGFVERTRRGRTVGLTISPAGAAVLRSVRKKRTVWLAERLAVLGEHERAIVDAALEPLERLLDAAA